MELKELLSKYGMRSTFGLTEMKESEIEDFIEEYGNIRFNEALDKAAEAAQNQSAFKPVAPAILNLKIGKK